MLTWDARKVENLKAKNKKHPGRLECLVWAAFAIGMNQITKDNVREWTYRVNRMKFEGHPLFIKYYERHGKMYSKELDLTEDDVKEWIGLRTNVCTIGRAAFDKKIRQVTKSKANQ